MKKESKETIKKLHNEFQNVEGSHEMEQVRSMNPVEDLKLTMFSFFKKRMSTLMEDKEYEDTIAQELLSRTDELSTGQLIQLLQILRAENTSAVDSLLSVVRPVPNAINVLFNSDYSAEDDFDDSGISEKDKVNLDKLTRMLLEHNKQNTQKGE